MRLSNLLRALGAVGGEGARRATRAGRFGSGALEGRVEIRRSGCGAGAGALVSPLGRDLRRGHVREGSEETVNYATAGRGVRKEACCVSQVRRARGNNDGGARGVGGDEGETSVNAPGTRLPDFEFDVPPGLGAE